MNKTAKMLSANEMRRVESLMEIAWNDPDLQSQKLEFCAALARTIGNEYKDINAGKIDAYITFWKAALLILYHESKQCTNKSCRKHFVTTKTKIDKCTKCGSDLIIKWSPKPHIADDPIKRKKFFQTIMFNYLKQILRENKPPSIRHKTEKEGPAPDIALNLFKTILNKCKGITYEVRNIEVDHYIIDCQTGLIPLKILKHIIELKHEFEQYGVHISLDWNSINIASLLEVPPTIKHTIITNAYIKFISLDHQNKHDEGDKPYNHYEYKIVSKLNNADAPNYILSETMEIIRSRLTANARKLFDIYISCPQEYIDRFKTDKLSKANLAKFLGVTPEEIDNMRENIRLNMIAMDIIPEHMR
ncbi:MAG: hypothetical protein QXU32_00530 [Nitrososphaerales archaeon]